jgi:anti-anti-sigma factor
MPRPLCIDELCAAGSAAVVAVRGELDALTAPRLAEVLAGSLAAGSLDIVVDLSQTTFVDSSGLNLLVALDRALRPRDGTLVVVVDPDGAVARALDVSGVDRVVLCQRRRRGPNAPARSGAANPA